MLATSAGAGAGSRALWRAPAQAQAAARRAAAAAASTLSRAGRPERSERPNRTPGPPPAPRPPPRKSFGRVEDRPSSRGNKTPYSSPINRRLASDALACATLDPRGGSLWQQKQQQQQNSVRGHRGPIVLAVPALPPADRYTDMGHDVVMPRASALRPLPAGAKTTEAAAAAAAAESNGGLRVRYGKQHVLHPWSVRYLEATPGLNGSDSQLPHCLAELTRRRYAAKSAAEPLWWFVLVHTDSDLPIKSVYVRMAMRRRVQRAFREALRRRGYDKTGAAAEAVAEEGERRRKEEAPTPKRQLYGSVRIEGTVRPLLRTAFEPLVAYLERVVGTLEQLLAASPKTSGDSRSSNAVRSRIAAKTTKTTAAAKTSSTRPQSRQTTSRDAFDLLEPSHF